MLLTAILCLTCSWQHVFGRVIDLGGDAKKILSDDCDCFDWYGSCRKRGESWVDDSIWLYDCTPESENVVLRACITDQVDGKKEIRVGENTTIAGFWHSCEEDDLRLRYEREPRCSVNGTFYHVGDHFREGTFDWLCLETGRWVKGCYYESETRGSVLLPIGDFAYDGFIKHVCDRYVDYPGRVQYYNKVRDDVHIPHSKEYEEPNESITSTPENLPQRQVTRWLHESVENFIANPKEPLRAQIRYLASSRREWPAIADAVETPIHSENGSGEKRTK